ncbi:MAG: hypothetical protein KIT69_08865, partial [Propionibacteriaceae bacterium]|nr:hypothetical protein [Propionibacteriaceae bacterium]
MTASPARALAAPAAQDDHHGTPQVRRQLADILKLSVAAVVGIEVVGNWQQVPALARWVGGEAVVFGWDLCAGLDRSETLLALLAVVLGLAVLALAVVQSSRPAERHPDDDQAGRIAAFRVTFGLVKASAAFAAAGAALAIVQVAALLAVGTPLQGSCTPTGAAYLTVLLASLGVLVACLVVLPISAQLETQVVRRAELQRLERQLERLQEWVPQRARAGWWRLQWAVILLAGAAIVSVLGLAWLNHPNLPLPAAMELAPRVLPVIGAYALPVVLLAGVPAVVAWWAVSLDLLGLARGLAVLSWLLALGSAGAVVARVPVDADIGPLGT